MFNKRYTQIFALLAFLGILNVLILAPLHILHMEHTGTHTMRHCPFETQKNIPCLMNISEHIQTLLSWQLTSTLLTLVFLFTLWNVYLEILRVFNLPRNRLRTFEANYLELLFSNGILNPKAP